MSKKLGLFLVTLSIMLLTAMPVYAQTGEASQTLDMHWLVLGMAIAAAGCGIAQSRTVAGGCEGVARNPGAMDTIRFFVILGLAFIEFLALLTFVVAVMLFYAS